ncbi:hypothetical protein VPAG_00014 [Vibrio phage douglas 12A4]|uniref:hypothetical protein n=1 Tax=Vibrio phage douglas 12A4 TaxID=573171 RepID=UPI0002C146BC|nr:hypothetical protein VPAG_00014 [Vibrio phage douglas 12A4]AGG58050.1 hypothetical protein VPAG_00014 [Vibrio phage douglas 12A4]
MPMNPTTTNQIVSGASAAVVVTTGVTKSLEQQTSLLNSTLKQVAMGDYTLFVSDIISVGGLLVGAASVLIGLYKLVKGKKTNG